MFSAGWTTGESWKLFFFWNHKMNSRLKWPMVIFIAFRPLFGSTLSAIDIIACQLSIFPTKNNAWNPVSNVREQPILYWLLGETFHVYSGAQWRPCGLPSVEPPEKSRPVVRRRVFWWEIVLSSQMATICRGKNLQNESAASLLPVNNWAPDDAN